MNKSVVHSFFLLYKFIMKAGHYAKLIIQSNQIKYNKKIEIQRQKLNTQQPMSSNVLYLWSSCEDWSNKRQLMLPKQQIQQISIGQKHIIIRMQNILLGLGNNSYGQLGIQSDEEQVSEILQINHRHITNKIKQISCGWNHTLMLDQFGAVFSAGQGRNGALGYGRGVDSYQFKNISSLKNIKFISAGKDHSLALSSIKVYGWGNSMDGQLGMPKQKICYEPQQLYVYASSFCFAGPKYSVFITEKGVYITGENSEGQLGIGNKNKVKMAKRVTGIQQQIIQVTGSSSYILYKTIENEYYLSGTGSMGQFLYPTKIRQFRNCQKILIGQNFRVIRNVNDVLTWDSNKNSFHVQNSNLSMFPMNMLVGGPKIVIGQINNHQVGKKNQKTGYHQRNDYMVRSSIQCINNQNQRQNYFQESIATSINNQYKSNQRKSRKQSEAIQRQRINIYSNQDHGYQQRFNQNYPEYLMQDATHNFQQRDQFSNNTTVKKQQITSPHFKKQKTQANQFQAIQNPDSMRMTQFNEDIQLQYSMQTKNKDSINRQPVSTDFLKRSNSKSIDIIYEQSRPLPLANGSSSGNITPKQSLQNVENVKSIQIINLQNEGQLRQKITYLQRENKKKDEQLKKMRKQLLDLKQIIESDACLKKIAQSKGRNYMSKKISDITQLQFQQPDVFTTNAELLRNLLGRTIDSLAYSG